MWHYIEEHPNLLIIFTVSCIAIALVLFLISWKSKNFYSGPRPVAAIWLSLCSLIAPITSLLLYYWVFNVKDASSVAQLNPVGFDTWHLWASAWPFLLLLNFLSMLWIFATLCVFFHPIKFPAFIAARFFSFLAAYGTLMSVSFKFPDA